MFALLLLLSTAKLGAQATSGFTQVGTVAFGTNTFADTSVTSGSVYQYEVLSSNVAGVSVPSNIVTAPAIPSGSGGHSATLTWTPPTTGGTPTQYLVYRFLVALPGPPTLNGTVTVAENTETTPVETAENQIGLNIVAQ